MASRRAQPLPKRVTERLSDYIASLVVARKRLPDKAGVSLQSHSDFKVDSTFKRMAQKYDIFNRAQWDPTVSNARSKVFFQSHRVLKNEWNKRGSGFSQQDYALRNAAWHVTDLLAEWRQSDDRHEGFSDVMTSLRPGPEEKLPIGMPLFLRHRFSSFCSSFVCVLLEPECLTPN